MRQVERVVVVGGGVGGLTIAAALKRAGATVEVHEKFDHPPARQTGFTIWSYAIRSLIDLGVDEARLDRVGSAIEGTELRTHDGKLLEALPVGEVSRKLGAPSYDCSRGDLLEAVVELLGPDAVHVGSECVGVEQDSDSASAILADGARATGDLLIGADGIHSVVRKEVAPDAQLHYSGFIGSGGALEFTHELLPAGHHIELWGRTRCDRSRDQCHADHHHRDRKCPRCRSVDPPRFRHLERLRRGGRLPEALQAHRQLARDLTHGARPAPPRRQVWGLASLGDWRPT